MLPLLNNVSTATTTEKENRNSRITGWFRTNINDDNIKCGKVYQQKNPHYIILQNWKKNLNPYQARLVYHFIIINLSNRSCF